MLVKEEKEVGNQPNCMSITTVYLNLINWLLMRSLNCWINNHIYFSLIIRFSELKDFHGIDYEKPSVGVAGPQKMASGLLCTNFKIFISASLNCSQEIYIKVSIQIYAAITLKCVGASIGEKPQLAKKLPGTTTVFTLSQ